MALDFPNSPSVGSLFTSQGTTWQYDGTKWIAATSVQPSFANPNKLINPFMEIDQANEGAAVTGGYVVDGWLHGTGTTSNSQRVTDAPPGYPNSIRATITASHTVAAGDNGTLTTRLEADDLADTRFGTTSAQTLTLAFWVKSSVAGTYAASLRNAAANRAYYFPVVISAANTWQLVSEVIPGDTAGTWVLSGNGIGLYIDIGLYVGSTLQGSTPHTWVAGNFTAPTGMSNTIATTVGATFQLGPVGLWVAPAAQPLLRTSFQAELARCQRYYEKSYNPGVAVGSAPGAGNNSLIYWGGANNTVGMYSAFKVTKRATPTLTTYDGAGTAGKVSYYTTGWNNSGNLNTSISNQNNVVGGATATGVQILSFDYVADARF